VACRDSPTPLCKRCKEAEDESVTRGVFKGHKAEKKVGQCCLGTDDFRSEVSDCVIVCVFVCVCVCVFVRDFSGRWP
jgi:hypothetical protein